MILILHYYKSTIDGVMTSLIDTFLNMRRTVSDKWPVHIKIICPELYLMDKDDYYNFDSGIQLVLYDLKKINLENTEQFDEYSQVIKRTDDFLKEIESKNLPKYLKFPAYDPNKLNIKIKETNELNSRIKQTLEHMINNMHEAYYNKGLKLLETGEIKQAVILFNKSVDTKKD